MSAFKGGIVSAPVILNPEVPTSQPSLGYVGLRANDVLVKTQDGSDLSPLVNGYLGVGLSSLPDSSVVAKRLDVYYGQPDAPSEAGGRAAKIARYQQAGSAFVGSRIAELVSVTYTEDGSNTQVTDAFVIDSVGGNRSGTSAGNGFSAMTSVLIRNHLGGSTNASGVTGISVVGLNSAGGFQTSPGVRPFDQWTGTASSSTGIATRAIGNISSGTIGTCIGISVISGQGTVSVTTGNYGISVDGIALLGATNGAGIRIFDQPSGSRGGIWFPGNSALGARAGISWGSSADTSVYRGAAGVLESPGDVRFDHPRCLKAPSIAAGAGAGTSPTIAIAGTDLGFSVTLAQGNPTATGVICTVTFGKTWTVAPKAGISPGNAATAALSGNSVPYVTTTATTLVLNSGSTGLTAGTQYVWNFVTGPAN